MIAVATGIGILALGVVMGTIRIDFNPESGRFYHPYGMPFYTIFVAIGCLILGIVIGYARLFTPKINVEIPSPQH
ncbi:MAG: hypothetical protein HMLIMOIP_002625 [Candidatus Nitrosomirales archaeon]|jgi:hypothetical protein